MGNPNTRQQQGGKQGGGREQELRGRTIKTGSYLDRYTGNTQRPTFPEAPEASSLRGPALPENKKVPYRQGVLAEDLNIPTRCTSPVSFKTHSTPQLNLQIPKQLPQHPEKATMSNPVKILKRHTSPYPTPASSPCVETLSPNLSPPARSNTYPVGKVEDVEQRYKNRMKSVLECIDRSQNQSKEPPKEIISEANPVPDFFAVPIHPEAIFGNSPDEVMMDSEYIAMGSVQDLEIEMTNFLPGTAYSEYMPDPLEPIEELKTNVVVTVDGPAEGLENQSYPVAVANEFLSTPMRGHPISDSGIGSMMGSPGRRLSFNGDNAELQSSAQTTAANKDFQGHRKEVSTTSSLETEAGLGNGSLVGRPSLMSHVNPSYVAHHFQEEFTPPSSASLSPSQSTTQSQFYTTMASKSIQAIQMYILNPMSENPKLCEFQEICAMARERIQQGRIRCLRDLEKFFVNMGNQKTMNSTVSRKAFFDAFLRGIQDAWPHVLESDRVRQADAPYSEGYFLDTRHQHGIETGKSLQQPDHQQRTSKRRLSVGADTLSPTTKRPMTNTTAFNVQQGTFVKPIAKPRQNTPSKQHLEIQTQAPFGVLNTPALLCDHPQDFMTLNPTFTFDESTKITTAKGQFHNIRAYHDVKSHMFQPEVPPFTLPAATVVTQHGGYWPPTPSSAAAAVPSLAFAMSPTTPASAVSITNPSMPAASLPIINAREEVSVYTCEICNKAFPRPCDLTKHRKTHERPFKCDQEACKYHTEGFPTNKERERHQNDIHASDSKEWKCQFAPCTYKSKRESNCKQHMEKAHKYVYKRMKRNPRRRDQGVPVTQAPKRRKNISAVSQSQPVTPLITSPSRPIESFEMAQTPQQQEPHILSQPFNSYFSQDLLDPSQIEVIDGSGFSGPVSSHMAQSFYGGSPVTNTDFERSPLTIASNGFDDHHSALRIHPDASPMLTDDWSFPSESGDNFCADQFFPPNNYCMLQPQPQQHQTPVNFSHNLDFGDNIQWNPEGGTPD